MFLDYFVNLMPPVTMEEEKNYALNVNLNLKTTIFRIILNLLLL